MKRGSVALNHLPFYLSRLVIIKLKTLKDFQWPFFNWKDMSFAYQSHLTHSWRWYLSYRNQSIDLHIKSMEWFLYDGDLFHEKFNTLQTRALFLYPLKTPVRRKCLLRNSFIVKMFIIQSRFKSRVFGLHVFFAFFRK